MPVKVKPRHATLGSPFLDLDFYTKSLKIRKAYTSYLDLDLDSISRSNLFRLES